MKPRSEPDLELLLAHASWLEALARRMVRNPDDADDLVQDVWLAAMKRPTAAVLSTRRWLAGIASNLSSQHRRGDARRRDREERSATEGVEHSAEESVQRASLGRELLDCVLALDEPFRSVVLMRYYEELSPPQIAERLRIPVRTVHSRLTRGVGRLRERWMRGHGDSGVKNLAIVAALPPVREAAIGSAGISGALMMNTKWIAGIVIGVACGGLLFGWRAIREKPLDSTAIAPNEREVVAASGEDSMAKVESAEPVSIASSRASLAEDGAAASLPEVSPEPADTRLIRGRVLDARGNGLPGVEVVAVEDGERALSAAAGFFELQAPRHDVQIAADDPRFVNVITGLVRAGTDVEPIIVVARQQTIMGEVVDEAGMPLQGARVRLEPPAGFSMRFDGILDAASNRDWTTGSDAEGRFEIGNAPVLGGERVEVHLDGFVTASVPAPPEGVVHELHVVLQRPGEGDFLAGRVLDAEFHPAPGCQVTLGEGSAVTDARGEFRLERSQAGESRRIMAARPGCLPDVYEVATDVVSGEPLWPGYIELVLGAEPLVLSGRIEDADGAPRSGLRVWLEDPTPFGVVGEGVHAQLEYLLSMSEEDFGDGSLDGCNFATVNTDSDGRFELGGLLDREYRLHVMNERTLTRRSFGPFRAGDDQVRIVFDDGELQSLRLQVVRADGEPVPGVKVLILGRASGGISFAAGSPTTDEKGRIVQSGLGAGPIHLWLRGDDIVPLTVDFDAGPPEKEERVVIATRCHFKVDLGTRVELADSLRLLDAEGQVLDLYRVEASGVTTMDSAPIVAGRSENLGVLDSARTLVLMKEDAEVERRSVQLTHGQLQILRP